MLHLTDLMPDLSLAAGADWFLPQQTLDLLARIAPTRLPVLCTSVFGAAFRRLASAVHLASGREDLFFVDLRRSAGTLPAGLPDGDRAARSTLALDGIEHVDAATQDVLAALLARAPFRLLSATDTSLDVLRARWRADLLARLSTVAVDTPALARRGAAIAEVARRRLTVLSGELGRSIPELSADAAAALARHPWPGDLAELDAVLARTLLASAEPVIDGVQIRFHADGACVPLPQTSGEDGIAIARPVREAAVAPGPGRAVATADDRAAPVPAAEPVTAAPGDARSAATADEALIATLPAPGLFRTRRDDEPRATSAPATAAAPSATRPGSSPTLEALAVELAHQLKNPLVTIKTFVGSIESLRDDPHELGQFRALTDEAVTRMDETLDGLLSFARLHAPVVEQIDVVAALREALRGAWRALSSKQVELDAPDGASLRATADREHVRFALATLARHVAETVEPRSRLAIAVDEPATLRLEYRESGAITHLRGASHEGESGLPLALLLVRGALARVGGDVEIALDSNVVSIRLRLSPP